MAVSLKEMADRPNTNYYEFIVDLIADIDLLPTTTTRGVGDYNIYGAAPMGSSCYCFESGDIYGLSSSGWKVM
jgi:hypothetical protein